MHDRSGRPWIALRARGLICLILIGCMVSACGCAGKTTPPTALPTPPEILLTDCTPPTRPAALGSAPTIRATLEAAAGYIIDLEAALGQCNAKITGVRVWAQHLNSVERDQ